VTHLTAMPQAEPSSETLLDADIAILGLSLRASNVLRRHDLHTVRDVTRVSPRKLFVMTRLGRRSVAQIASSVERRGLRLAEDGMRETGAIDGAAHR
jgi:DNA-directed RNA polymerase alpha subunit